MPDIQTIIDALLPEERDALAEWARLATVDTIAAGGRGQTATQIVDAQRAWESLSPMLRTTRTKIFEACLAESRAAQGDWPKSWGEPPVEPEILLGDDWAGWPYINAPDVKSVQETLAAEIE